LDHSALVKRTAAELQLLSAQGELVPSMDSIDMVNLFVGLEAAMGRSIPPELVSPEVFASVESIAHALRGLAHVAAQSEHGGD
jgi:hypothetical protein